MLLSAFQNTTEAWY